MVSPFTGVDAAFGVSIDMSGRNSYYISMKTIVSEKGQITIPKAVRDNLGIVPGTVLEVESSEGKMVAVKKLPIDVFAKWRGKGKLPIGQTVDEYIDKVRG
jgi:AbrB family looped-hinge helix DNA binding protein